MAKQEYYLPHVWEAGGIKTRPSPASGGQTKIRNVVHNIGNTEHDEHSPRPGVQHDGPGLLQAAGHQHGGRQAGQVRHRDGVRS